MLDQATPSVVQDGEPPASYCLDSDQLGDFSSQERMQQAGWLFGWTGVDAFKPQKELYASSVPTSSYWGFSGSVDGEIALVLRGRGFVGLDFGNAWTGLGSQVVVYLNGMPQSRAGAYAISVFVKAPFRDGDVLRLVESNGVIVINSIFFDCVSVLPAKVTAPAPLQAISTSAAITTASETETASTTTLATTTQTTSATTQTLTFSAPSGTTIRDTTTLQEHAPLHRQRESDRDAPKASRDQRVSEPEHADHGKEEPAMSDIKALRLRAKKQQQYESHMSEAVARESKKLEELEDMEKEQLLKAQRDMQLEKDLKEELHRMVHG